MFKSLHKENGKKVKISIGHHKRYTILKFKSMFSNLLEKPVLYFKNLLQKFCYRYEAPATTLRYYANVKAEKLKEKIDKLQMLSAYDNIDMKKPGKTLIPGKKERNFRGVAQPG